MKVLFVHDHPFKCVNGELYSTGGLNNNVLKRYTCHCDSLDIVARIIPESNVNNRWSKITDNKVKIFGSTSLKYSNLEEKIRQCDKLIVRLPSFLGTEALRINKKYKKPFLIEMVGCAWDSLWNHSIKGKLVAPYMLLKTKQLVKDAPYVIYVTKHFLQNRYPAHGKTLGCSDVEIVDLNDAIEEKRIQKLCNQGDLCVIGTIAAVDVKYKGQEYVIRALGELKKRGITKFRYKLVGNGDNTYLRTIAEKHEISDMVEFIGGIPHERIFDWLDSIDIYIQPSKQEGLPRAVIEAMSRGVPVIGSEAGGVPELVDEQYRFNSSDYKRIADILQSLTRNELIRMSRDCFNRAHDYQKHYLDCLRDDYYSDFFSS